MAIMALNEGVALLQRRMTLLRGALIIGWLLIFPQIAGEAAFLAGALDINDIDSTLTQAVGLLSIANMLVTIGTIIIFAMWIYRAAANVIAASVPGFDYTAGWSVGWYFIPFANLIKPFQAMRQIWNASLGGSGTNLDGGETILTAWWALWLVSNITANISARMALAAETQEMLELSSQIGIASLLLSLILYPIALRMVEQITQGQAMNLDVAGTFS